MRKQGVLIGSMILMVLLHAAQWAFPIFFAQWMTWPRDVVQSWEQLQDGNLSGSDWRTFSTLISCGLLHADITHIAGNMLFYWIFGALVGELIGWRWLLVIFFVSQLAGAVTHVVMNQEDYVPMLGASGMVSALMGAYLAMSIRWQLPDPHIWPIARPIPPANIALLALGFFAMDYTNLLGGTHDGIAYGVHVGGFAAGLFLAGSLPRMPKQARAR